MAIPAMTQATEKRLFGKPYVSLGRLFILVGEFVFQQGGLLGYTFKEEPDLLEKLLAPETGFVPGAIIEYLSMSIKGDVEDMLSEATNASIEICTDRDSWHLPA